MSKQLKKDYLKFWPIVIGIIAGLSFAPVGNVITDEIAIQYNKAFPVVTMKGEFVSAEDNAVRIHIQGSKNRDCRYLRINGFTVDSSGQRADAVIRRIDLPETGTQKAPGVWDIGTWEIRPIGDGVRVQAEIEHLCGNRIVKTLVADVSLGKNEP